MRFLNFKKKYYKVAILTIGIVGLLLLSGCTLADLDQPRYTRVRDYAFDPPMIVEVEVTGPYTYTGDGYYIYIAAHVPKSFSAASYFLVFPGGITKNGSAVARLVPKECLLPPAAPRSDDYKWIVFAPYDSGDKVSINTNDVFEGYLLFDPGDAEGDFINIYYWVGANFDKNDDSISWLDDYKTGSFATMVDGTDPTGTININNYATHTDSPSVTLYLSAWDRGTYKSGVSKMEFKNESSDWSGWEDYSSTPDWTLSPEGGIKTVYVHYKDNAGNVSNSISYTIIMDTTPPTAAITLPEDESTVNRTIEVTGTATDTNFDYYRLYYAPVGTEDRVAITDCISDEVSNGILGSWDTKTVPDGDYYVVLDVYDKAGNFKGYGYNRNYDRTSGGGSYILHVDNSTPDKAHTPCPADDEQGVPLDITLSWECGHPRNHDLEYDIYIGTSYNPPFTVTVEANSIAISDTGLTLEKDKTYRWYIVARDKVNGKKSTSDLWSFETVVESGTINVKTFQADFNGVLSPISANFSITRSGVLTFNATTDAVSGEWTETFAPLGYYDITFEAMSEFVTPSSQTLWLKADGDVITFETVYMLNDTASPESFNLYDPSINGSSVTFNWDEATDPEPSSGIDRYELHISGIDTVNAGVTTTETIVLNDGDYNAYITAFDRARNNTDSENSVEFTVNGKAPSITVTISKDGVQKEYSKDRTSPPIAVSPGSNVEMSASDGNGIDESKNILTLKNIKGQTIGAGGITSLTLSNLQEGEIYIIEAKATDDLESTSTLTLHIQIYSGSAEIINGKPYNFPNPFGPEDGTTLRFYISKKGVDTKILIYNSSGKLICQKLYTTVLDKNEVSWDGKDMFGNYVANGPYFYFIVADGKVLGRGEMAAYR